MKILIVEDEKPLAESVKALLEKQGFEAECVYDGLSGLEYARSGGYDLLILDVMLPGLDGRAVAERVRAGRCGTPILMLTALSGVDDRVAGLDAGADYYLAKPFDSRELLACVNALLRRQGGQVDELAGEFDRIYRPVTNRLVALGIRANDRLRTLRRKLRR